MRNSPTLVLCLTLLLGGWSATATEVYRWTDEDGNVIFSDVPREGAEQIEIGEVSTVPGQRVPPPQTGAAEAAATTPGDAYTAVRITAPADEATIRNQQQLDVGVSVDPALDIGAGHRVQFYFDGAPYGEPVAGTTIVVQPLERGTHQLGAAVVDAAGNALRRAETLTIYVHQQSVLNPAPARRAPAGS